MITDIEKDKLPKGFSYALKTSELAKVLEGVDCPVHLVYSPGASPGCILRGFYWLPNENVPHVRCYVTSSIVPSTSRAAAAKAMVETVLPDFSAWLRELLALPANSTRLLGKPVFEAHYADDYGLVISKS